MTQEEKEEIEDSLIDEVIENIKQDIVVHQDVSAIFELLRFCSAENLIQYLPENRWGKYEKLKSHE